MSTPTSICTTSLDDENNRAGRTSLARARYTVHWRGERFYGGGGGRKQYKYEMSIPWYHKHGEYRSLVKVRSGVFTKMQSARIESQLIKSQFGKSVVVDL